MGSALSMRFCQRCFGLWVGKAETYDGSITRVRSSSWRPAE